MNGHKPKVKGDGTTHWYECKCGNPLNPYETICPKCLDLIDWSSEIKGDEHGKAYGEVNS